MLQQKKALKPNYANDLTDEFVEPFIVEGQNNGINDGDAVIFSTSALIEQLSCQKYLLTKPLMVSK